MVTLSNLEYSFGSDILKLNIYKVIREVELNNDLESLDKTIKIPTICREFK